MGVVYDGRHVILRSLCGKGWCGYHLLGGGIGGVVGAGFAEDIEAEVAAAFDPFVVLFG